LSDIYEKASARVEGLFFDLKLLLFYGYICMEVALGLELSGGNFTKRDGFFPIVVCPLSALYIRLLSGRVLAREIDTVN